MGDAHQDILVVQQLASLLWACRQQLQDLSGDRSLDIAHVIRAELVTA